jgi:tetratricopeptide (TPR) repeat protein
LSKTGPPPEQLEVDADSFLSALDGRAFEGCLRFVERAAASGEPDPVLNCRLAEALLHDGRREEALACVRRGFAAAEDDPVLLHICAWVFSNCNSHRDAAAAYRRLLDLCPEWIEGHRHLSASLAAAGNLDEAIAQATIAATLAPDNAEFGLHLATLLAAGQRCREAFAWAMHAVDLSPGVSGISIDAAEIAMRCGRAEDAAAVLRRGGTGAAPPRLWRVLSSAEMLCGRFEAALDAAQRACVGEPGNAEYALHRGHLLWQAGDMAAAGRAFATAAALDPEEIAVKRAQLSFLLAAGLGTEATVAGGELLHRFPDDKDAA